MVDGSDATECIVVHLSGEIDITTAAPIEAYVNGLEADGTICFDVSDVEFEEKK